MRITSGGAKQSEAKPQDNDVFFNPNSAEVKSSGFNSFAFRFAERYPNPSKRQ
jgi:hypothetical protein